MSTRAILYNAIAAHLQGIKCPQGQSIIKHINLWNRQFDGDRSTAFGYPAVFIEFAKINWQSSGLHKQMGDLQLVLHIANTTKTTAEFGTNFTERYLAHLELIDILHKRLTGFNSSLLPNSTLQFSSLSRTDSIHDHYHGDIILHQEHYKCTLSTTTAYRYTQQHKADYIVDNELILQL